MDIRSTLFSSTVFNQPHVEVERGFSDNAPSLQGMVAQEIV